MLHFLPVRCTKTAVWSGDCRSGTGCSTSFRIIEPTLGGQLSKYSSNAVSFHVECLLFSLPDSLFVGGPADHITATLSYIAATPASTWYNSGLKTPCGERYVFGESEWGWASWDAFHKSVVVWADCALSATGAVDRDTAIKFWQLLLGEDFFPRQVSQ